MHDLSVDRTTNGRGLLADMDATRIRKLDAGQDQSVPTLRDALDLVENRVPVNIELKSWDGCAQAVAAVLREYIAEGWSAERFLVSSFHHPELWEFRALLPEVPTEIGRASCRERVCQYV